MEQKAKTALHVEPTEDGLFIAYAVDDYRNCAFGETPDEALDNLREKASDYSAHLCFPDHDDLWA